jgi:aldose 1-epimerase
MSESSGPRLTEQPFGTLPSGEKISLYKFRNANGLEAGVINCGGRLVSLKTPDRSGHFEDIVLGFDDLGGYCAKNPYFGALVGRYANRIANGQFSLDGHTYNLVKNSGANSLHGGAAGFDKVVWNARRTAVDGTPALELTYVSADGEEGYPGALKVRVVYALTEQNELRIDYHATTDKRTVLNLTNHSYFDLSGQGKANVLDHIVTIHADRFTPINENLIPTGDLQSVENTPFDFRNPMRVGDRIDEKNEQLKLALGYDHNYVLKPVAGRPLLAARAVHPGSGRALELFTTQPGVQFYTGNHLDGTVKGKNGVVYGFRSGFCLETQHFPDSPNHPNFPSTELSPGQVYQATTIFRLSSETS